jgi:hypothetical protein
MDLNMVLQRLLLPGHFWEIPGGSQNGPRLGIQVHSGLFRNFFGSSISWKLPSLVNFQELHEFPRNS